jgi:beta-ribofuranosylaminobenzene 5'-phosphate synthase
MASARSILVATSARLHFGLWAWGPDCDRQFGGVGMMVRQPMLVVQLSGDERFGAVGPVADRVQLVAERCSRAWGCDALPACRIEVTSLPPRHAGFGVGTQLAMAVARGLAVWTHGPDYAPEELAAASGRGLRSAVGTHGFAYGGLIVDAGKRKDETVGQLLCRVGMPDAWRVVLVTPKRTSGLAGEAEKAAFRGLPPVPPKLTQQLRHLALEQMLPACHAADFERFAAAVHEYGRAAGLCFESIQGGPYAGQQVSNTVEHLRGLGADGVGQSSWGPTVFAFMRDETSATTLADRYRASVDEDDVSIVVTSANNQGASVVDSSTAKPVGGESKF